MDSDSIPHIPRKNPGRGVLRGHLHVNRPIIHHEFPIDQDNSEDTIEDLEEEDDFQEFLQEPEIPIAFVDTIENMFDTPHQKILLMTFHFHQQLSVQREEPMVQMKIFLFQRENKKN